MSKTYCIFTANYPPHVGGVENYSQRVASELARRGNHVYVITSTFENEPDHECVNENLEIIRLPSIWLMDSRMPILKMSKAWRETRKRIAQLENPRIIIQTFLYPLSYAGARLARQKKWPFIVINHGCNYVCQGNSIVGKIENIYEEILARLVMYKSSGRYAVSKASGKWLEHFGSSFSDVLSNAIDVDETLERLEQLPCGIRDRYGIGKNTTLLCYVGRMILEKGVIQLVQAVKRLQSEGYDIALIAAGDGPILSELKEQNSEKIHFIGRADHDDVLRLFRESDCCCLPSDSEGFGVVLLEAALCKCYLIGSPYGGIPEAIGEYGIVMKGNTCQDIEMGIKEYLLKQNAEWIANKSFDRVKQGFSWRNTCDRIEGLDWESRHKRIKREK